MDLLLSCHQMIFLNICTFHLQPHDVNPNSKTHNSLTVEGWEVNQQRSRSRSRTQMARMVMLHISCQQEMKPYAS